MEDDIHERRKFIVASVVYAFLEIAKKDPSAKTLRLIEDAMFLPRVVDKLRSYLGPSFFGEIEECMFLSDFKDDEVAILSGSIERLQRQILALARNSVKSEDPRRLIHDWLCETMS